MIKRIAGMLLAAIALPALSSQACSWANPGINPFRGDRQAAIWSYEDIDWRSKLLLSWKVRFGHADDQVTIGANGITGSALVIYGDVRGMHFGRNQVCDRVDRSAWPLGWTEAGLAYRQGNRCIIVPTVCGNISWTTCDTAPAADLLLPPVRRVPEPGSLLLCMPALLALMVVRRRRRAGR